MITNILKINDLKTEFIVFRSPQLKCDVSVNVGKSMITQSPKVRDLGVIFDQFLNFYDHITAIKILMLTYYNMSPPYLCELINKKESHVNIRLGTDHYQLIMTQISKDCSNTFLERLFIYTAPCEWNKLREHFRTSNFDCFRKSVKTMLFTQQYGC